MSNIRRLAQQIRHTPGLERANWLWSALRKPYHRLINFNDQGVAVCVGGIQVVRMPPEYTGLEWETYEPETFKATVEWLHVNSDALVLDIGSSIGIFSVASLFASWNSQVIAFDSDLPSLKATQQMCRYASGERLRVIHGFVAEEHKSKLSLSEICAETASALEASALTGDLEATRYVCLDEKDITAIIPTHSIDGLMDEMEDLQNKPILIKCDVEGAELFVLQGAKNFIERFSPYLLLSVHPQFLPKFESSELDVKEWLKQRGYQIEVLSIDHEEHWWCQRD